MFSPVTESLKAYRVKQAKLAQVHGQGLLRGSLAMVPTRQLQTMLPGMNHTTGKIIEAR